MAAEDYYVHRGTNFYTDMAAVASGLGLAVTYKSAIAFASLVSIGCQMVISHLNIEHIWQMTLH